MDPADSIAPGRLVSLNVGLPRSVTWFDRVVTTGIWKEPVEGPVALATENFAGDRQADLRVHGGPEKAVYAYATEDYAWWATELGQPLDPGTFGENLTTADVEVSSAVIGERWRVGTAELEVCQPRQPCFKLGIRMGDADFVTRFDEALRPGAYLRVVRTGTVERGDTIEVVHRPDDSLTVVELLVAFDQGDVAQLGRLEHNAYVTPSWRDHATRALAKLNR